MVKANFPPRRALVGWIWFLYGLGCWVSTMLLPNWPEERLSNIPATYALYCFLLLFFVVISG